MASSMESCGTSGNSSDEIGAEHLTASFTPREYQIELLEAAKDRNTIACLGTGTGKTFIAVMLIKELATEVRVPFDDGGKRIIFLVPTVPLVNQQKQVLEQHTDLKIAGYYGEMEADTWDLGQWHEEFKHHEVLVMTAEICRIILHHAFLKVSQLRLLIFDECHRAQGCHPYREIMKCFEQCPTEDMPRVFGLSASLLNQKIKPISLEKKILELEKTLRSTVETASDLTDVQKYGTDPKQYLVIYDLHVNPKFGDLSRYLMESFEHIRSGVYNTEENSEIQFFNGPKHCVKNVLDALDKLSVWCAYHVAELYLKEIKCLLNSLQYEDNKDILTSVQSVLENFKQMCDKGFSLLIHSQETDDLSPKLRRLLEIFVEIKNGQWFFGKMNKKLETRQSHFQSNYSSETRSVQSVPICGIVFVEQRITAYILCHWLTDVVKNNPDLQFLVPGFVVGHGKNQKFGATETSMSFKKQTQVISDFRKKKLNMLFATCVIEEGVDIPKCNVVIRFDLPPDFRSYVQSKGRARAQNSIYVMLASSVEKSLMKCNLDNYLLIEKLLMERCHNREMPSEEEIREHMDDDLLPPYMPDKKDGAPRITLTSAIGLVNRYCAKLPCDKVTKLFPRWKIFLLQDPLTRAMEYVCHMNLPINSSVRETIVGEKMSEKRTAKKAAALKACELLHKAGELDDYFICHSILVDNILSELVESVNEEETSNNGLQPGTKKYRRVYNKGIADAFKNTLPLHGKSCYLYVLEMKLTEPLSEKLNRRRRPIVDPSNTSLGFGILSRKEIPKVCAFPIFTRSGKVVVSVKYVKSCLHCEEEIVKLSEFHKFLFSRSLYLENSVKYCPSEAKFSIFIVPVNKDERSTYYIDWDFIDYTKKHPFNSEICKPKNQITRLNFKEDLFMDCVVTRSYAIDNWNEEAPIFHFVNRIEYELSPCSNFMKSEYSSYKKYYKIKYDLDIQFDNQPLLETERINSITLWKPLIVNRKQIVDTNTLEISKSKQKSMNYREHLIPELCIIHPFPATLFRKAINIPTILFRLNSLLVAEQLRKSVTRSMSVGEANFQGELNWPVFEFEKSNKDLKNALNCHVQCQENVTSQDIMKSIQNGVNDIISFEAHNDNYFVGPSPGIILQALTPKSAGDEFDLERLETIGDSFLKYSMSVKMYTSYPNFDEGKLTRLRSGIIRNLNLYKLAKNKLLPEFLVCEPFNGKSNWLPPCYIIDSDIEMELAQKRCNKKHKAEDIDLMHLYTKQVISDKCVADSVEALIGAYLLHCGHLGALNFMYWVGLNAFPAVSEESNGQKCDGRVWPPIPRSPMLENASTFHRLCILTNGMERFENIINYHFKNKAYLLQAFTHPSYVYNDITDCFQRLEFLGDAVLDFLITRKLYDDPKQHTPGDLSDLRAALVNNTYFAALAIKYEYNKFIKMLSPHLFMLIEVYIELMKSSQAFQTFEVYGYFLEEVECFEIEEIEVPKALGDVFESVAGAIYLDSGMSLDAVWKVYYPLMKPSIDYMSVYVPKTPVRQLLEMLPYEKLFGNPVVSGDKVTVEVKLPSGEVVCGVGPNKNVAKRSAAKRAVSILKEKKKIK